MNFGFHLLARLLRRLYFFFVGRIVKFTFSLRFGINRLKTQLVAALLFIKKAGVDLLLHLGHRRDLFVLKLLTLVEHFQVHPFLRRHFLRALETTVELGLGRNL